MQRRVGGNLVRRHPFTPEPRSIQADVGVGQIADEREQLRDDVVEPIAFHLHVDGGLERLQSGQNPAVEHRALIDAACDAVGRGIAAGRPLVNSGVGRQERIGVVPGQQCPSHHVADAGVREPLFVGAHQARVDEVQAQRIGAVGLHELVGRRVVAQALRHLLAVLGQHHAVDDDVAKRRLLEQRCGQHHQGVEPAAGLVQPFGNVLGRKACLEQGPVLERVVQLRIGHRAGFEPAIEHFVDATVRASFAIHGEGQRIDVLAMQVGHPNAGEFGQFVERADATRVAGFVIHPDRQRRTPDSVARDRPVDRIADPVAEPAVLDVARDPAHLFVAGRKIAREFRHANEPRWHSAVDERRVGAIAVRIAVDDHVVRVQAAGPAQMADDVGVGVLHELPLEVGHLVGEYARHRDGADKRINARGPEDAVVVLAERRRLVHQPGAFGSGDVVVGHHHEGAALPFTLEVVEERAIPPAYQRPSLGLANDGDLGMPFAVGVDTRRGQVEAAVAVLNLGVVDVRTHANRQIRGQRPRRGGPAGECGVLVLEPEEHRDRRVLNVLVVLASLEVGKHGLQ